MKVYYENKVKTSNQQQNYYEKYRDKLLQKQNDRYIHFKELLKFYNGLQNRLKALKENISTSETSTYHIDDALTNGKDI